MEAERVAGRKTRKKYRQWGISEEKRILEELPKVS
jgi:hypothetical protein